MSMKTLTDADIRVLLIDDEVEFTATLAKRLRRQGMVAFEADSAEMGFAALEESPFDVVLLDVHMPQLDGLQALKVIKTNFPQVEVILLTGRADVRDAVTSMYAGAFDFMVKPAPFELVLCKIRDAATTARLGAGAPRAQCPAPDKL